MGRRRLLRKGEGDILGGRPNPFSSLPLVLAFAKKDPVLLHPWEGNTNHCTSFLTPQSQLETLPDVAVRQSPALLQQQPHLWPEFHVEILAISTINMDKQWHLSQISHG